MEVEFEKLHKPYKPHKPQKLGGVVLFVGSRGVIIRQILKFEVWVLTELKGFEYGPFTSR